jgi:Na+-translocating ferredoxin:NAD+ oxidoreductase RnfC subunit
LIKDFPFSKSEIAGKIFDAGVVGAGGAGFPTHIKAKAGADVVIANGCECEPLIQSDKHVLSRSADEVLEGLLIMMLATGAGRGSVAVREGFEEIREALDKKTRAIRNIEVITVANNYPAGDEHVLVYEATGRVIPQGLSMSSVRFRALRSQRGWSQCAGTWTIRALWKLRWERR